MEMAMKVLTVALLMLVSVCAPAAFAYTGYSGTLSFIGTDWNGAGYIFGLGGVAGQCSFGQFSLSANAPGYKDQVATLMLAWTMGESVAIVTDATDSCPNNRANIISVQIPAR
jgi:hypothetical protein